MAGLCLHYRYFTPCVSPSLPFPAVVVRGLYLMKVVAYMTMSMTMTVGVALPIIGDLRWQLVDGYSCLFFDDDHSPDFATLGVIGGSDSFVLFDARSGCGSWRWGRSWSRRLGEDTTAILVGD